MKQRGQREHILPDTHNPHNVILLSFISLGLEPALTPKMMPTKLKKNFRGVPGCHYEYRVNFLLSYFGLCCCCCCSFLLVLKQGRPGWFPTRSVTKGYFGIHDLPALASHILPYKDFKHTFCPFPDVRWQKSRPGQTATLMCVIFPKSFSHSGPHSSMRREDMWGRLLFK